MRINNRNFVTAQRKNIETNSAIYGGDIENHQNSWALALKKYHG